MHGNWYNPQEDLIHRMKRQIERQLPENFSTIPKNVPIKINIWFFLEPAKAQKTKKFLALIQNEDYPYLKKPDRDNLDKLALDTMSKMVFNDDNQVYAGTIEKHYSTNPRTIIEVIY